MLILNTARRRDQSHCMCKRHTDWEKDRLRDGRTHIHWLSDVLGPDWYGREPLALCPKDLQQLQHQRQQHEQQLTMHNLPQQTTLKEIKFWLWKNLCVMLLVQIRVGRVKLILDINRDIQKLRNLFKLYKIKYYYNL